ncbi:MAG TPA: response regulator [Polyangiaceae bacterium]|jgi:CheY-like chemotaxis protein
MTNVATRDNEGSTLLLVEDDPGVARAVVRVLGARGHAVDVASTCGAARHRTRFRSYGLAIVDVELPDGLGPELAEELLESGCVGRVLFFTSETLQPVLRRAALLGSVVAKRDGAEGLLRFIDQRDCGPPQQSGLVRGGESPAAEARRTG